MFDPLAPVFWLASEPDQAKHGGVDIEAQKVSLGFRKNFQKRADDYLERWPVKLVQGKPLAEQTVCGEAISCRSKLFKCIERTGAVLRGMKKVGDDHIVLVVRDLYKTSRVGSVQ